MKYKTIKIFGIGAVILFLAMTFTSTTTARGDIDGCSDGATIIFVESEKISETTYKTTYYWSDGVVTIEYITFYEPDECPSWEYCGETLAELW